MVSSASADADLLQAARLQLEVSKSAFELSSTHAGVRPTRVLQMCRPRRTNRLVLHWESVQKHEFEVMQLLGRGGFGCVYKCQCNKR